MKYVAICALALQVASGITAGERQPRPLTLNEVVRLHTESVQQVFTLKVRVSQSYEMPTILGGGERLGSEYTALFKGREVRIRAFIRALTGPPPKGLPGGNSKQGKEYHYDVYNGPDGSRSIEGYDPDDPPPLEEDNDSGVFGYIGPHLDHKGRLRVNPYTPLLLQVPDFGADSWPLDEFIGDAKSAELEQTPGINPEQPYVIRAEHQNSVYRISISPAKGFVMTDCRIEERSGKRKAHFRATEYHHIKGAFIPKVTAGELSEGATLKSAYTIQVLAVNEDIPASEMEIQFPEWMRVYDQMTGKLHIWGEDGEPQQTFRNADEYRDWYTPLEEARLRAESPPWYRFRFHLVLIIAGWCVVLAVLWVWFRKRGKTKSPNVGPQVP